MSNIAEILFSLCQEELGNETMRQREAAKLLSVPSEAQFSQYLNKDSAGDKAIKKMILSFAKEYAKANKYTQVNAVSAIGEWLVESKGATSQEKIAGLMGMQASNYATYKSGNNAKKRVIQGIVDTLIKHEVSNTVKNIVRPILEFKKIKPTRHEKRYQLLPNEHYEDSLKAVLENKKGVYLFYNSQGKNVYIGMTERDLHFEIVQQLDRPIEIYAEGLKKINVKQGEIAHYLSAYEVQPTSLIKTIEALLIRAYANDNTNIKMENFPV